MFIASRSENFLHLIAAILHKGLCAAFFETKMESSYTQFVLDFMAIASSLKVPALGASQAGQGSDKLEYQTDSIAPLADGACLVSCGRTQVLATVAVADTNRHVPRRHFLKLPLQVWLL